MPNSLAQTGEFSCPQCHRPFTADVWLIIDMDERPDLVQRIRVGDLHAVTCPHCGHGGQVDAPLLLYLPHAVGGQLPLIFSPAQRTTTPQNQAQGDALISRLSDTLSADWQDAWLEQIVTVPRRLLAALLSEDPEAALRALEELSVQQANDGAEAEINTNTMRSEQRTQGETVLSPLHLIKQLVQASSWDELQRIIDSNPKLLGDEVDAVLTSLIIQAERNTAVVKVLSAHLGLLRHCRAVGMVEAILAAKREAQQVPPKFADNLSRAKAAEEQYLNTNNPEALDVALAAWNGLIDSPSFAASDERFQTAVFDNAGVVLLRRYLALGSIEDLKRAIEYFRKAVMAVGSPDLPSYLNNLGTGLNARYEHLQQLTDLEEAVSCFRQAVAATSAGSPNLPGYLNNLGNGLSARYVRLVQLVDLEEAVHCYKQAVATTAVASPDLPGYLNNLGGVLRARYLRLGQLADLSEAVRCFRQAVAATAAGSPNLAMYFNNLGVGLSDSYALLRQMHDLEEAVYCHEQAVAASITGSPALPGYLNNLGTVLSDRYVRLGQMADLERAVREYERAVELTLEGSLYLPSILNNLGTGLSDRYVRLGQVEDSERAVHVYERAMVSTPDGSPTLPSILNNLGNVLSKRYALLGQADDLKRAVRSYRTACTQGESLAPNEALNAARNWGRWALGRGAWAEAVEAYEYGSATGRLLLARHWSRAEKTAWLRELQAMPAPFAYALAQLGRLEEAVLAAEHGRARLLAEALERTRRDLDLLPERGHPHLIARYQAVVQALNQLTRTDAAGEAEGMSGAARLAAIAAANAEFEAVVAAIREVEGYADFLAEPTFTEVAALSAQQPLVYLLATAVGGLALIVHGGAVQPLWLADLTEERLDALLLVREGEDVTGGYLVGQMGGMEQLSQHLPPLLAALGELIAQPLAATLHSLPGASAAFTLFPSGRLALLPLHAAPLADGRTLQDAFAVRYSPSSIAATAAERRALLPGSRPLLALADPQRPGLDPAWFTDWLGGRATAFFGGGPPLLYEQAGEAGLRAQLAAGAPTHLLFGCHGIFNIEDPLASGLELADGLLTLAQLLDDVRLDGVDLVTLCACQTAIADFSDLSNEALGLPAAILQAGARRVAGTLWPVDALATVLLLAHFYELLAAGVRVETALAQSAAWLRTLSSDEAERRLQTVLAGTRDGEAALAAELLVRSAPQPFAHPMYWAAFTCTGAGEPT